MYSVAVLYLLLRIRRFSISVCLDDCYSACHAIIPSFKYLYDQRGMDTAAPSAVHQLLQLRQWPRLSRRFRRARILSVSSSRYSSGRSKSDTGGSGTGWPHAKTVRPFRLLVLRAASL